MSNSTDKTNITIPAGERQTYLNKTSLWETHPEIANLLVDPQDGWRITKGSGKLRKVAVQCDCGGVNYRSGEQLVKRKAKMDCGSKAEGTICPLDSLLHRSPDLASQLVDQSLASQLSNQSGRSVEWTCGKHIWTAPVQNRVDRGDRCPYCTGRTICLDNCLLTTHPEISKELVDESLARELSHGNSRKKVLWQCDCGNRWLAPTANRVKGHGCPKCVSSKMNKWSLQLCKELSLDFKAEARFDECRSKGVLPFDVAIFDESGKTIACIEAQGEQHFESVAHFGGGKTLARQQKHDQIKRDYCETQGIPLIEVHYSQRDFKSDDYGLSEWFRQYLLTELHTHGIIGWETFSEHSKPWQPAGETTERLLPLPAVAAGIDRNGVQMVQQLAF